MTKKSLALALSILVVIAAAGAVSCRCAFALEMRAAQATGSSCGHCQGGESQSSHAAQSEKSCCGKCQFDRAAVLGSKAMPQKFPAAGLRCADDVQGAALTFPSTPTFLLGRGPVSPFFLEHVLNTTYSLHAPPAF